MKDENEANPYQPQTIHTPAVSFWGWYLFIGALLGFVGMIFYLIVAVFVLGFQVNLQTGVSDIDSMLYAMNSIFAVLIAVAIRGLYGAIVGTGVAAILATVRTLTSRNA